MRALEFDVLVSKDDVPVITHDYQLSGSSTRDYNGKWIGENGPKISELTLAQLKQFDVGGLDSSSICGANYPQQEFLSGIRIPKLSELLDLACLPKGQNLYGRGLSGHGREKGFEALFGFSTLKTVASYHQ